MKKFVPLLILLIILTGFLAPRLTIAAQETIPACCKLSRGISLEEVDYKEGIWVGLDDCADVSLAQNCGTTGNQNSNCITKKWGLLCLLSTIKVVID